MQIGSKVVEGLKSAMETSDGGGKKQTQLGGGGDQWCWLGFMGLGSGGQLGLEVVGRSGFFGHWWGLKVVNRWKIFLVYCCVWLVRSGRDVLVFWLRCCILVFF